MTVTLDLSSMAFGILVCLIVEILFVTCIALYVGRNRA